MKYQRITSGKYTYTFRYKKYYMEPEKEKILEKRSSLRSWRERGGKIPHQNGIIGIVIVVVFLGLVLYPYFTDSDSTSAAKTQNSPPLPQPTPPAIKTTYSIPAPSIKLRSPENVSYNTSIPLLDLLVAGSSINTIFMSIDGNNNIAIPHDGSLASVKYNLIGEQAIKEDFSKETNQWASVGRGWRIENGRYLVDAKEISLSVADLKVNSSHFGIEATVNNRPGGTYSNGFLVFSYSNPDDYYYAGAYIGSKKLAIGGKGFVSKIDVIEDTLGQGTDYNLNVVVDDGKVDLYYNGIKKLEYDFGTLPPGKAGLLVNGAITEFDDFSLRLPFSDGIHNITIYANNTAGNASYQTVYFTVNTSADPETGIIGEIGSPLIKNGLEISVKSVTAGDIQTTAWISVKNLEDKIKPFKLSPSPTIIDNNGTQYESVRVSRSSEIMQTDLYPYANREGAVFFMKLKEGTSAKRMVLYANGNRFEFDLNLP